MEDRHPPFAVAWAAFMVALTLPVALGEAAILHVGERVRPPKVKLA